VVRGKNDSSYSSSSSYYALKGVPMTTEELIAFLASPPVQDPDSPIVVPKITDISQVSVVKANFISSTLFAQSWDVYLGVQVICYRGLRAFLTLRDVSYTHIGEYVVPKPGPSNQTTALNAGYEGYTVGLSYRF
jgi:hypothetical protein